MKFRNRFRKTLVMALAASMVSSLVSVPAVAGEVKTGKKSVTFTVSAGDLLIATNPVPFGTKDDGSWDFMEEDMGTVDLVTPSSAVRDSGSLDRFEVTGAGEKVRCATVEKNEKFKAWKKKHPGSSEIKTIVENRDYEVGDLMWHGYDRDYGLGADVIMKGAPVYEGDIAVGTAGNYDEGQPQAKREADKSKLDQVYRRYKCMATEEDFTLWCYVAGSETTEEPAGDYIIKKEEGEKAPVYLSESRAEKIRKELVSMNFIKRVEEVAGDSVKCDAKGDKDKKVAIIIEPMNNGTLGFVWGADRESSEDYFKPLTCFDCLHVQAQCTLGTKFDGETWTYDETTGVPPYATMSHELTHYIVDGYCETADSWINEWFAQSVMVDVVPWDGSGTADKTVSDDVAAISWDVRKYGALRNYAGPVDPEVSVTYPITTLMAGYFTGRMGCDLWKDVITHDCMTEQTLSEFLEKREGGLGMGLQWWLGSFNLAVMGQVRGPETWGGEDNEFLLNPFGEDDREKGKIGGTHTAIADFVRNDLQETVKRQQTYGIDKEVEEDYIIKPLADLTEESTIKGGGSTQVFEVEKAYIPEGGTLDVTISGVGDDVIWARKDGAGMIDMGSTAYEEEGSGEAARDADGNWTYTTEQKQALEQSMRIFGETAIEGTDAKLVLKPFAKEAAFYTGNKKALTESLVDKDKSSVSINGVDLKIKKVTLKNIKKAYVSKDSLFRSTISENNMTAYASYNENKLPGYVLTIDTKGITDPEIKKAAKKANKMLKKYPVTFDLLPVNLTSSNVTVTKYNDSKQVVKKLTVTDQDGNVNKLKKKDFSSEASGDVNEITGEINYNGQVLYDPATNTIKAI
ncbi:MAG: hypothetical protein IJ857_01025 [Lachnospiraceae bacterium]|nr:hypothetical protein [Lachnospiraceae bacterium]